jgi:hypothetical protein
MGDRLILERIAPKEALIVLTDAEPGRRFRVIAIGPKVQFDIQVGDIVFLPGVASNEPDHVIGAQIFVREEDLGCKLLGN